MVQENLQENLIEVSISDVSITNVGFAIFLKPIQSPSRRVVPIFIGPLETYSISTALDGVRPPRPNTHDLLVSMLEEMEARVLHIVINDIIGSVFYARVVVQTEGGVVELDARPSDSVAIAIRSKCSIYIHEKVYEEASVVVEGEPETQEDHEDKELRARAEPQNELEKLKDELQKAVESENFERAAIIRDKIKKMAQEN